MIQESHVTAISEEWMVWRADLFIISDVPIHSLAAWRLSQNLGARPSCPLNLRARCPRSPVLKWLLSAQAERLPAFSGERSPGNYEADPE
jgi:hypothetical protein